jgi:hypothetical protein
MSEIKTALFADIGIPDCKLLFELSCVTCAVAVKDAITINVVISKFLFILYRYLQQTYMRQTSDTIA